MKKDTKLNLTETCSENIRKIGIKIFPLAQKQKIKIANNEIPDSLVQLKSENSSKIIYWVKTKLNIQQLNIPTLLYLQQKSKNLPLLILSDYVSPKVGMELKKHRIQFCDTCGNMFLDLDKKAIFFIIAYKPQVSSFKKKSAGSAFHFSGTKVLFTLLSDPMRAKLTLREIAARSGVAFSTVGMVLRDLKRQGQLIQKNKKVHFIAPDSLIEQWLISYSNYLRPKIFKGFFRFSGDDPLQFLKNYSQKLNADQIKNALAGEPAANYYTQHLIPSTVSFFAEKIKNYGTDLSLMLTSGTQGIEIFDYFSPNIAFQRDEDGLTYIHPLLVYAEMLYLGTDRHKDVAKILYDKYIKNLFNE